MRTLQLIIMICILVAGSIYADRTVDNKNGTLTDKKTGLIWEKCNEEECSEYDFFDAKERCDSLGLAGKKWRLPTIKELIRIYDYEKREFIFPIEYRNTLWSESKARESKLYYLFDGSTMTNRKSELAGLKCVSGKLQNYNNFLDNKNGTVTDNITKLTWQKCSVGQNIDFICSGEAIEYTQNDAKEQCESLNLAGKKWRLPTMEELSLLISFKRLSISEIYINEKMFPNTIPDDYWTSTNKWVVRFSDGFGHQKLSGNYYVRCVTQP